MVQRNLKLSNKVKLNHFEFGEAKEQLLGTNVVEINGRLGIDACTRERSHGALSKTSVLDATAYGQGACRCVRLLHRCVCRR